MSFKIWIRRNFLRNLPVKKNLFLVLFIVCIWYFGILRFWLRKSEVPVELNDEIADEVYDDGVTLPTPINFDEAAFENRIVHFDLKGAAPKPHYFKQLLRLISRNGATGILIEYEDMFPFENGLKRAKNDEAYTKEELEDILGFAKELNLTIIPLIQSFGHLEWILKLPEYRQYRDHDVNSGVVCISNQEAVKNVVEAAFTEILQFHQKFDVKIVHIGGDEAFNYGKCFPSPETREELAANYLVNLTKFVRQTIGSELTRVLIWNDMVDQLWYQNSSSIEKLKKTVELVVWDYGDLGRYDSYYWEEKGKQGDLPIWGASAFKGADGANKIFVDLKMRQLNNLRWAKAMNESKHLVTFGGLILTGWQRYDHFSTFCELLPMAIPSLVVNLNVAKGWNASEAIEQAIHALDCNLDDLENDDPFWRCRSRIAQIYIWANQRLKYFLEEEWPELKNLHEMKGWFRYYNRKFMFSNYHYLDTLIPRLYSLKDRIATLKRESDKKIGSVLIGSTAKEFAFDLFGPILEQLMAMITEAEAIIKIRSFKKRPFEFDDSVFAALEKSGWW